MKTYSTKAISLLSFVTLSLLLHGIAGYTLARFGRYDFARPVGDYSLDIVELTREKEMPPGSERGGTVAPRNPLLSAKPAVENDDSGAHAVAVSDGIPGGGHTHGGAAAAGTAESASSETGDDGGDTNGEVDSTSEAQGRVPGFTSSAQQQPLAEKETAQALGKIEAFVATTREKLSYQVSLYGLPVGGAVLEAANRENETRITLTVRSNAVISSFYPVADFAETRLIGGKYIVSNIRQQEGSFRSDMGFTLCLPLKSVIWTDRLTRVVMTYPVKDDDVLDILSGAYLLRNLRLEVGRTVRLRIFDRQKSVEAPVEVLRRERVILPGFREADTVVIRPGLPTEGLFRRNGDLLVWLTDDEFKVPVKMETTIPLGKVTAELISSEVERSGKKK